MRQLVLTGEDMADLIAGSTINAMMEDGEEVLVIAPDGLNKDWRRRITYEHTHTSVLDGSPAMLVSQDDKTITLINEDGFQWTDPRAQWQSIEEQT